MKNKALDANADFPFAAFRPWIAYVPGGDSMTRGVPIAVIAGDSSAPVSSPIASHSTIAGFRSYSVFYSRDRVFHLAPEVF